MAIVTFHNLPRPLDRQFYEQSAASWAEHACSLPGVLAVYRLGGLSAPGISDLDFVVVLRSGARLPSGALRAPAGNPCFLHHPFVVSDDLFRHAGRLAYISRLEHFAGEELGLPEPAAGLPDQLALLWDECFLSAARPFLALCNASRIDVRNTLSRLHGLRFDMDLARHVGATLPPRCDRFAAAVTLLRQGWFDHPDTTCLMDLVKEGAAIGLELADALDRQLPPPWRKGPAPALFADQDLAALFVPEWQPEAALTASLAMTGRCHVPVQLLPFSLQAPLWVMAAGNGVVSAAVRARLTNGIPPAGDHPLVQAMAARTALFNAHADFLHRCGLPYGYFKQFGNYPQVTLRNRIRRLLLRFQAARVNLALHRQLPSLRR